MGYLGFAAPTVADHNKFYYPHPEAKYRIVHPKDIGEVVAEILAEENVGKHLGQTYEISGSMDQWIDAVKDHPTINDYLATHLREFSAEVADGRFDRTTNVVRESQAMNQGRLRNI